MNKTIRIQFNSMKRSKQHVENNPFVPVNTAATSASIVLGMSITKLETLAGGRTVGTGTFHGATEERQSAKDQLLDALSALSLVSKSLDKTAHPDLAAQLKMDNQDGTYQGVLAFARAAVAIIEPIEQVFVDHGASATVVEDLQARIATLDAAGNRKNTGLDRQVGKTAALRAEARIGMAQVRKLDAILSQLYKSNVELYTAWKAAKRLQKILPAEQETAPVPPSGS